MFGFSNHREWVYPKYIRGRFQKVHRYSGIALQALLVIAPWVTIGGLPLVHMDLPGRRLTLLGGTFTAVDGFLLVLVALMAAFSLFFFTSLFGRIWCGYLCPQTVFMEEWVRPIENFIEGDRGARMRRDKAGFTWATTARKAAKFVAFGVMALFLGMTVISYFATPWALWTGQAGSVEYALVAAIAGVFFFDWAWFREQTCNYVCPYARFQGALTDDHSLVVTYDVEMGEPRQKGKAAVKENRCHDCGKCVVVCPQGIDIRDGYQLECINCARCIDACEDVMGKLGNESLVKYTTIADQEGKGSRWIRPRTVAYAALLLALLSGVGARLALSEPFEVSVNRSPGTLFQMDDDGFVRNTFLLNVKNNDPVRAHTYEVRLEGLDDPEVTVTPMTLEALEHRTVPLIIRMPTETTATTTPFTVTVFGDDGEVLRKTTFKAPGQRAGEG